jgi:nucleoporin NUP159
VLARTKAVRDAFSKEGGEDNVKDFQPALEINVPKLSQVAFTADGTFLVICAQEGGGLGVYETQSILQDKKDPAFQLPTNSISIRALSPNPAPEFAHLVAVILTDGKLLIADLKSKDFNKNAEGSPALSEGVAAVSWSNRGKQLTAGMADGNCFQLDQSGTIKARIPAPQLPAACHVSSLVWLANDEWLIYHTLNTPENPGQPPESYVHHVQADKERSQFVYRKPAADPVGNWGLDRTPLTHYIARLRNWHNIKDWLIVSSVASTDVAMLTNSSAPLATDAPHVGTYTVTTFANDSSKFTMPFSVMNEQDTTAIGMAIDLTSTDKVPQPIPGDEMDESPFPLPALMLLNNEGILVSSWVVYNDALRNNIPCPDMAASVGSVTSPPQTPQVNAFGAPVASPAASAFGSAGGAFAKPVAPAFGSFGGGSAAPAFGGASAMGGRQSVWGNGGGAAAGKPAFGQTSMGASKPAFGSTSAFGAAATNGASPFGAAASKPAASSFGAFAGSGNNAAKSTTSPFGAFSGNGSGASPFGAMASNSSPFGQPSKPGQSAFATSGTTSGATPATSFGGMSSQPSFGSTVSVDTSTGGSTLGGKSVFGTPAQPGGLFNKPSLTPAETQESDMMDDGAGKAPTPKEEKPAGLFGMPADGFKLGTLFKPDNKEDKEEPEEAKPKTEERPKGLFGADFGAALGDAQKEREQTASPKIKEESKESPSLFGIPAAKKEEEKPKPSLFGSRSSSTPKTPFSFGKPSAPPSSSLKPDPEPPQVQSKPAPSPSTTTAPSTESKASSKGSKDGSDDSGPLAGSEAEAVEMPESDDDDLSEEAEIERDDPLPPDPSTYKVSKDFYDVGKTLNARPAAPVAAPASTKAPSPPLAQKQPTLQSPQPTSLFGKMSTTPAGFPKAPEIFQPRAPAVPKSPRSPSPVRSASTPAGRPFSKPSSRPSSVRPQLTPAPHPPPQQHVPETIVTPPTLQDKEAERNRTILDSAIQPTLTLPNYISHEDYIGAKGLRGDGKVSSQIETLFYDINSMVDSLGLNARALTEFIEGHNSMLPDNGRTKEDLDNEADDETWCLVEIEDLISIERELGEELDSERIEDKEDKVGELYAMRRDLVRAKNKLKEVKRFLEQAKDEEKKELRRKAPLDKNTEARQREIRQEMARFLKVLVEAEEAVTVLKVKLASTGKQAAGQVPTVEAVEKTVRKMTQWAEEKGADMDVLEAQMQKLGLVGPNGRPGSASKRASLNGSSFRRSGIFSTPSPKKASPKKSSTFAVPEESDSESDGFVEVDPKQEVVREMVEARRRKTAVLGRVREAIRRKGVKITEA